MNKIDKWSKPEEHGLPDVGSDILIFHVGWREYIAARAIECPRRTKRTIIVATDEEGEYEIDPHYISEYAILNIEL